MAFLRPQTYPYAITSTGQYRGLLVRKYDCWDAKGPVRDTFTNEIAGKIKNCLEQCLPESNCFVGFSLFMVGKSSEKTKPTIMIVSDDKARRKAAFQMVKAKNILSPYPGFELGHCSVAAEFEDLRQLGSNTKPSASILESIEDRDPQYIGDENGPGVEVLSVLSAEVCAFEYPSPTTATRIYFHTSPHSHSHDCPSATCGGLFEFENEVYALTMAHAIRPVRRVVAKPNPCEIESDSSSESDDFEITGMDDWDDDDEDGDTKTLTAITSPGSKTPSELSELSGSEESLLRRHDSQRSSDMSIRTRVTSAPSIIYEDDDCISNSFDYDDDLPDDLPDACERIGSVVSIDHELDIALVKLKPDKYKIGPPFAYSLPQMWMKHRHTADDLTNTSVVVNTTHHPAIRGQRSGTPFYTRFPGASNFLELHSVQLSASLRPGDSGSWAFDSQGEVVGFVVAGNPNSVSCLLLPIAPALRSMFSLLHKRLLAEVESWLGGAMEEMEDEPLLFDMSEINRDQSPGSLDDNQDRSRDTSPYGSQPLDDFSPNRLRDAPDDDTMTVASSFPPPSIFSQRMDRGTPSTIAYSTMTSMYERIVPRGNAESAGNFISRGDFLQDQVTKLRRELERAWEIIQDKDKRLQNYITGNVDDGFEMPIKDTSPAQYEEYPFVPSFSRGSAQTQHQSSPSVPPSSQTSILSEDSRAGIPKATSHFEAMMKALRTELETNRRVTEEIKAMWRTQVDANETLLQENAKLKKAIEQAIETTTDYVPVSVTGGDGLRRIASDLSEVLRGSDGMKPAPFMIKMKDEAEANEVPLMDIPPFPVQKDNTQGSSRAPRPRAQWHLQPNQPSVLYSRGAFKGNTFRNIMRRIDKVVEEEEDDDYEMGNGAAMREDIKARRKTKDGKHEPIQRPHSIYRSTADQETQVHDQDVTALQQNQQTTHEALEQVRRIMSGDEIIDMIPQHLWDSMADSIADSNPVFYLGQLVCVLTGIRQGNKCPIEQTGTFEFLFARGQLLRAGCGRR
ncbi:hypothetical protein F5Y09DRAFT_357009 [Xylaria sp. FL1042]|nr:hypothetical protein F5Y09DRAFT_357009 [Xylaria sp. FL1042]